MGFKRMALRTVVILCLVLISITLTLSSNRVNRKETVEDDYDLESSREKSKHGRGSKDDNKSKRGGKNYVESKKAMTMKWICSLIYPMEMTMKWICSLIYLKEMTIKVIIKRSLL